MACAVSRKTLDGVLVAGRVRAGLNPILQKFDPRCGTPYCRLYYQENSLQHTTKLTRVLNIVSINRTIPGPHTCHHNISIFHPHKTREPASNPWFRKSPWSPPNPNLRSRSGNAEYIVQCPQTPYWILIHETTNGVLKTQINKSTPSRNLVRLSQPANHPVHGPGASHSPPNLQWRWIPSDETKNNRHNTPHVPVNSCLKWPTAQSELHKSSVPRAQTPICGTRMESPISI